MSDNPVVKDYADRFLFALERIADALEGKSVQKHTKPLSTPEAVVPPGADKSSVAAQGSNSYDDVRKAVMAYQDAKGARAALDVLRTFGANYILDLKKTPEKYGEVLKALAL
jgi:hypothetical protein